MNNLSLYQIRVKSAKTCPGNGLLERTTPVEINVAMETKDRHNLTFIALRKVDFCESLINGEGHTLLADFIRFTEIAMCKLDFCSQMKDMDVSGHVKTSIDHVTSLKAKLCLEDNEDSPVHTVSLGIVPFFFFPAIPIDDRKYVVILETSLPRHRYDYPGMLYA